MGHTPTNTNRTNVPVAPDTVRLPDVLAAIDLVLAATPALAEIRPLLAARIEDSRQRSERHNRVTRGQQPRDDTQLVQTRTGVATECRRCGRVLAIEATPKRRLTTFPGEGA